MVPPVLRRHAVSHLHMQDGVSQRRACRVFATNRASVRYQARRANDAPLRDRLRQRAHERPRVGYQRLHGLLQREGQRSNHTKVYRL